MKKKVFMLLFLTLSSLSVTLSVSAETAQTTETTEITETAETETEAVEAAASAVNETAGAVASVVAEAVTETAEAAAEKAEAVAETAEAVAEVVAETAEAAQTPETPETIPDWAGDSPAMASIVEYVASVTDESSPDYVPPTERIAMFDSDGTLLGERFPTYFDQCLLMYRLLHDDSYEAAPEDKEFAAALEEALLNHKPEPDSPRSTAQMAAESFKGYTVEEYRAYVRKFMSQPVPGFEGLTYGDRFFKPMVSLVQYLAEHDFIVYICSGTERSLLRELITGTLDQWIPPYQVIGTGFSLIATNQGDTAGRSYTYSPEDQVLEEGNMTFKNLKMNKVVSIVNEVGIAPILVFGNSSGDFSMAQYALQNGGKAYMLLCDDTERDYGDLEEAESFAKECDELGFETVSMRDEFQTIYGDDVIKTEEAEEEALEPAA